MIGLVMLLQAVGNAGAGAGGMHAATVGDTIWVTRAVQVAPRQTVRPVDWNPPDPVEAVGRPQLTTRGTTVEIHYPLTIWRAGRHRIEIPGPLVLGADGSADSLPPQIVTLDIRSVLPTASTDSQIAPQPRAGVVRRRTVSLMPLGVLLAVAVLLLFLLRFFWRRRGPPAPGLVRVVAPPPVPVERWVHAGEHRAVASLAAARLRAALGRQAAETVPAPELAAELSELLDVLDQVRFGSHVEADALELVRRAEALEMRVDRGGRAS